MPNPMIERIAQTLYPGEIDIFVRDCNDPESVMQFTRGKAWVDLIDVERAPYVSKAREVLSAMREPTEAVTMAMFDNWAEPSDAADMRAIPLAMWNAGVVAALAEEG